MISGDREREREMNGGAVRELLKNYRAMQNKSVSCSRTAGNEPLHPADETHEIRGSPVELKCAEGERRQISS